MKTVEELNQKHSAYKDHIKLWNYYYNSFVGGHNYRKAAYLRKYYGEHLAPFDVYQARLDNTPYDNHVKTVIDVYRSFIFSNKPKRELGNIASNPFVEQWIADVDLDGQDMDSFMKTALDWAMCLGNVWISVDKPAYAAATAGEELAAGIRAYATQYTPQNVLNWVYERDLTGRQTLAYICVIESQDEASATLKSWYRDGCERYTVEKDPHSGEFRAILDFEEFENPLGYIPFVNLSPTPTPIRGIGHSTVADICDMSRSIYNKLSELEQGITLSTHPSLVKSESTEAEGGAGAIINIPEDLPADKNPYLLQPAGTSITSILESIANDVDAIDRMSHLSAVRAHKTQSASGVSLQIERQLLNTKLGDLSDSVNEAERKLWKIWFDWQSLEPNNEFKIEYVKSYDIRDEHRDLELYKSALEVVNNTDFREHVEAEIAKMVVDDEEDLAFILRSIAAQDRSQPADIVAPDSATDDTQ